MIHVAGTPFASRSGGFTSWLIRVFTGGPVNHAGGCLGDGQTVEGQPGGARFGREITADRAVYATGMLAYLETRAPGIGNRLAARYRLMVGAPYSWLTIGNDALAVFRARSGWIDRLVVRRREFVCSALVDQAFALEGVHLFTDGRLPGQVRPEDLLWLFANDGLWPSIDVDVMRMR